jgi:hypothetical protein
VSEGAAHTVVDLLESPELLVEAASSPAVRGVLQTMREQVESEIATLNELLSQLEVAEPERLRDCLRGREVIAARLREILADDDGVAM